MKTGWFGRDEHGAFTMSYVLIDQLLPSSGQLSQLLLVGSDNSLIIGKTRCG
jgi:hypothetical protein